MPRCLFCLNEHETLTNEHVFPAALGGALVVEKASCVKCNNRLSNAFEQTLANRFADFRRLLFIPDRYGKVPELFVKVEADGETLDAKLMPDGNIQLKPVVTAVKKGGAIEVIHQHPTDRQKEELGKRAKEQGFELIEEQVPGREAEVSISGELDFIDAPEMLRTATKIAYCALALRVAVQFAMHDIFADARTYILTGDGKPHARLFLHEGFLDACAQGPHQHSVVLVGRNNRHRVDAIVRLFGALCYFVTLTERYEGTDFYNTLVYDAQRRTEGTVLVVNEQAEFLQVEEISDSKETVWSDRIRAGRSFLRFLAKALKAELHD